MFVWIARWILQGIALYIVASLVPGIHVSNFYSALIAVIIIGLVNTLIKPIFFLLTLPLTLLTFGIFSFIINALMLLIAGNVMNGFRVEGFGAALLGSVLLSVVTMMFHQFVR